MQLELRHVGPIRAANIVALLYALSMLIFAIPMFVLFTFMPGPSSPNAQQQQIAFSVFRWVVVAYPFFGLVFGWFAGLIGSFIYNLIAARLGGFQLEYRSLEGPSGTPGV